VLQNVYYWRLVVSKLQKQMEEEVEEEDSVASSGVWKLWMSIFETYTEQPEEPQSQ